MSLRNPNLETLTVLSATIRNLAGQAQFAREAALIAAEGDPCENPISPNAWLGMANAFAEQADEADRLMGEFFEQIEIDFEAVEARLKNE